MGCQGYGFFIPLRGEDERHRAGTLDYVAPSPCRQQNQMLEHIPPLPNIIAWSLTSWGFDAISSINNDNSTDSNSNTCTDYKNYISNVSFKQKEK